MKNVINITPNDIQKSIDDLLEQVEYQDLWRKEYLSRIDNAIDFIERYLKLNLDLFDTRDLLEKILDILK